MDDSMCIGDKFGILHWDKKNHHTNGTGGGRGVHQRRAAGGKDADERGGESEEGSRHRRE